MAKALKITDSTTQVSIKPLGEWTLSRADLLKSELANTKPTNRTVEVDGSELVNLDTAGAFYLYSLLSQLKEVRFINFSRSHAKILELVTNRVEEFKQAKADVPLNLIQRVGKQSELIFKRFAELVSFLGETTCAALRLFAQPQLFRVRELFVQLERVLLDAIPIVALVTGLIGIVVAYLFSIQLIKYGANIFIVDGVTLAMCRELSPLIVAIIMAGRSGSAFTAQIGTMKINEEIDAMSTLGLSPQQVLVLPRVIALVLAMPLLVFVGNVVGVCGGMAIVFEYAGVTPDTFVRRIYTHFPIASFYIGLAKAPVYAFFVALIGCAFGFNVENNARSVGENTTRTVVYSIVLVIILNAAFAILFAHVGFPGSK